MKLNKIKEILLPIEEMARPIDNDYTLNAVDGKIDILHKLSKEVPQNGVIVEIGSLYGSTAILMALSSKSSVEIHGVELNILPELSENISENGLSDKITIYAGASVDIEKLWEKQIDLLYIDGHHSYDSVLMDSRIWTPYVKRGGVVVWHDYYNNRHGCKETGLAIDKFLSESEDFEAIMPETTEKIIRVAKRKL